MVDGHALLQPELQRTLLGEAAYDATVGAAGAVRDVVAGRGGWGTVTVEQFDGELIRLGYVSFTTRTAGLPYMGASSGRTTRRRGPRHSPQPPSASGSYRGMDAREKRLAANEALFREVNERVQELARRFSAGRDESVFDYVCECAHDDCTERVSLSIAEYERLRTNAARFAVVDGHEVPSVERVVERHRSYVVVEKIGEARDYVERLDPRSAA